MSASFFQWLALGVYLISAAGFFVGLIRQSKTAGRWANRALACGLILHTASLVLAGWRLGQLPVLDLAGALNFFGWALAAGYLLVLWRFKLTVLGAFAAPLTVLLVLLGALLSGGDSALKAGPVYQSVWLTFHLAAIFGGYAFFGLAFVAAVMYLLQERQIKSKRTGPLYRRLPSLNVLDSLNYTCLTVGFPLMTLGLILGVAYAQITLGSYWRWDPKEVWSLILWLFYAALLHQRITVGWRGRRAAILAIVGFSVLCFTFVGVSLILPGYHSFENLQKWRMP